MAECLFLLLLLLLLQVRHAEAAGASAAIVYDDVYGEVALPCAGAAHQRVPACWDCMVHGEGSGAANAVQADTKAGQGRQAGVWYSTRGCAGFAANKPWLVNSSNSCGTQKLHMVHWC